MRSYVYTLLMIGCLTAALAQPADRSLDLAGTIRLAAEQSPSVKSARNAYLAAYWNYRYYRANYLPSVTLSTSPSFNHQINPITQSDGTSAFLQQNQLNTSLGLRISQNIPLTGGNLWLNSSINRLDELANKVTSYSSQPLSIGYSQDLFGYNSLKWDRRIEPLRFREAKKNYAEALELVAANACGYFFQLASAQNELEMAQQNFASADTLYQMAKGRYEIGLITENEMLQLEINRLNEETNVMDAQIHVQEQQQGFRSFLGLAQDETVTLTLPDSVPDIQIPLDQALSQAQENSPEPDYYELQHRQMQSNLANARANAGLRASIYMQLGLSQTGSTVGESYRNPLNQQYASVSLSLPILDWGRGKGRIRVAQSQLELTETQTELGMQNFRQNVQKLVMQFNMQGRKVTIARLTHQRAVQRHSVATRLYVMGRSSILDLNAAIAEKNSAQRSYIAAHRTFWTLYYTLRSMGVALGAPQDNPMSPISLISPISPINPILN